MPVEAGPLPSLVGPTELNPAWPVRVFPVNLLQLAIDLVGGTLDKQHPEDELTELRYVHLAAQIVR